MGLIYLIQPEELITTNRCKIGCSSKSDLSRVNSYKKKSRYLCIMDCKKPFLLEKIIKTIFNDKFIKIAGNEFFEGNEIDMIKIFIKCYIDFIDDINNDNNNNIDNDNIDNDNIDNDNIDNDNIDNDTSDDENINSIKEEFINYIEDENFGGTKKLVKIIIPNNKCIISKSISNNKLYERQIYLDKESEMLNKYIQKLIENNIIENNNIYDFNDKKYLKKLDKYKNKINVTLSIEDQQNLITIKNNKHCVDYIEHNLFCHTILNNYIYCNTCKSINSLIFIHYNLPNISKRINLRISIHKVLKKNYDYDYLRKYIPYIIEINSNRYYLINRDYEYIGLNTHCNPLKKNNEIIDNEIDNEIDDEIDDKINESWERIYLFNDGSNPWYDDKYFNEMYSKFDKLSINKECLNRNEETFKLLNIN
jgi:hypothetical protein